MVSFLSFVKFVGGWFWFFVVVVAVGHFLVADVVAAARLDLMAILLALMVVTFPRVSPFVIDLIPRFFTGAFATYSNPFGVFVVVLVCVSLESWVAFPVMFGVLVDVPAGVFWRSVSVSWWSKVAWWTLPLLSA